MVVSCPQLNLAQPDTVPDVAGGGGGEMQGHSTGAGTGRPACLPRGPQLKTSCSWATSEQLGSLSTSLLSSKTEFTCTSTSQGQTFQVNHRYLTLARASFTHCKTQQTREHKPHTQNKTTRRPGSSVEVRLTINTCISIFALSPVPSLFCKQPFQCECLTNETARTLG